MIRYDCHAKQEEVELGKLGEFVPDFERSKAWHPHADSFAVKYPDYEVVVAEGVHAFYFYDLDGKMVDTLTLDDVVFDFLVDDFAGLLSEHLLGVYG